MLPSRTPPAPRSQASWGCWETSSDLAPTLLHPEEGVKCMAHVCGFVSHTHGHVRREGLNK